MMKHNTITLKISGRVQGVGFRYFVLRIANELGIKGIVRNEQDERVSIECEPGPNFDLFLEKIRAEHPGHIDEIKMTRTESDKAFDSFMIGH